MHYTLHGGSIKEKMSRFSLLLIATAFSLVLSLGLFAPAQADSTVTPSTNDINRDNGWAHVNATNVTTEEITLEFVSTRDFASCFEYRTDGDTSQNNYANGGVNYNPAVTDGLYPFTCVNSSTATKTLTPDEYVEVRMVFGAEGDERFDWTRFDLLPQPGEIISPTAGEEVEEGEVLSLVAVDEAAADGNVQWAVRSGSCSPDPTRNVAGNVGGFNDAYMWQNGEFTADVNTEGWALGEYCFVFNPTAGDRYTQNFMLVDENPEMKDECKKGGWEAFNFRNQGQCVRFVETNKDSRD